MTTTVYLDERTVGFGKTQEAIEAAIKGGKWLFAVGRKEAMIELKDRIRRLSNTKIVTIHSDDIEHIQGQAVKTETEALTEKYFMQDVIAIITHKAMMLADFTLFSGWNLVCDEVPEILDVESRQSKLSVDFFKRYYQLEHIYGEWSLIKTTKEGSKLSGADFKQDSFFKPFGDLHSKIVAYEQDQSNQAVVCNLTDLDQMTNDKTTWANWSLFSLTNLKPFNSIRFLASDFSKSITYQMMKHWNDDFQWKSVGSSKKRNFKPRTVNIQYFSKEVASTSLFQSETGKANLAKVAKHIADRATPDFIWSSNDKFKADIEDQLGTENYFSPKQAGNDTLMNNTSAAMIYTAKPDNMYRMVIEALGTTSAKWIASNEYETILQFVSRICLRDANSSKSSLIFVYDRNQAYYLKNYFENQSHINVQCDFIPINLETRPAKVSGRPSIDSQLSPVEAEQLKKKQTAHKSKQRAAQRKRGKLMEQFVTGQLTDYCETRSGQTVSASDLKRNFKKTFFRKQGQSVDVKFVDSAISNLVKAGAIDVSGKQLIIT